jgi:hypothetical protein
VLNLRHCPGFSFVVDPDDFPPQLKLSARRCRGKVLENRDLALTIHYPAAVELGNPRDLGSARGTRVEIDNLLVGVLEAEDNGVSREGRKLGVELLRTSFQPT